MAIICKYGKNPEKVKARLKAELGFDEKPIPAKIGHGTKYRICETVTRNSEIWKKVEPGPPKRIIYVRHDEFGHDEPPGRVGRKPHYHVDVLEDPDAPTGPITNPKALEQAKEDGVPLDSNNVPLDKAGGRPLTREENYEQRFEPTRTPINNQGNPDPQPQVPPNSPEMDAWAERTHLIY